MSLSQAGSRRRAPPPEPRIHHVRRDTGWPDRRADAEANAPKYRLGRLSNSRSGMETCSVVCTEIRIPGGARLATSAPTEQVDKKEVIVMAAGLVDNF